VRTPLRIDRLAWLLSLSLGLALTACDGDECVCDDDDACDDDDDDSTPADDDDDTGPDADGDGWTIEQGDCNDGDGAVHPAADEACDDEVDSDCDGVADSGCTVEIEAGDVLVGSDEMSVIMPGQFVSYWDERPEHEVDLSAYRIDRYEVTNSQYRRCVSAGDCEPPADLGSATRETYHEDPAYGGFPVVHLTWQQAGDYCAWKGGRLPTEAEWEKGAKGPDPNDQTAPWGHLTEIDDWYAWCDKANYGLCEPDTVRIGSYDDGVSPYGLHDMTGNAAEWVVDWYDASYYSNSLDEDPTGPDDGRFRVIRGGSWNQGWFDGRVVRRKFADPEFTNPAIGFRCVFE